MTDNLVRIATYWSSFDAETAKLHLDSCGIPSIVSSGALNAMLGELGGTLSPIELLVREEDVERTTLALDDFLSQPGNEKWVCSRCDEEVPGTFANCWSCGSDRANHEEPNSREIAALNESRSLEVDADAFVERNHTVLATDPNSLSLPYAPPSTLSSPSRLLAKEFEAHSALSTDEMEAIIDRAWRAAIVGMLLPVGLHFYSLYLLFQSCRSSELLSTTHQRKFVFTLVINFFAITMFALLGLALLAGSF
ncbi:MAG: hypothetical protein ACK56W_06985 [Pirellula sp.]|jgi:hypothetical protein